MKKKMILLLFFLSVVSAVIGTVTYTIHKKEKDLSFVELETDEERKILFYRDDCPDCKAVYPQVFFHNLRNRDTVFVNLNQQKNRRYISKYQIKTVPTIIHKDQRYEGMDQKQIQEFLKKE
ncbi:thioredoxin family protein [Enterococcus avium]|uniref:thioredoxin family protein n=1 Tax=Enterococcus avium TaxID=33945 RepID=UPI001D06D0AE|nr:thioredoxin family protein [Enterococcus avium]MCB6916155.1 thioredoxin family protein [Enterococcus avium]MCQ4960013.1 thioredoxin family protein [Enterococcus avium]